MNLKTENTLRVVSGTWLAGDRAWQIEGIADRKSYFLLKRIFDVVISVVVIAGVLSWLLPLLALLIRLDSKGPVLFIQQRVGRRSKLFSCYKLRTMQSGMCITRLGGWLRRSHLDELPQFFNVLFGSMSIVGPRPYMPTDCEEFAEIVPDGAFRHRVRPGITGMAQAKGLHGPIQRDRRVIFQRYHWDAFYVNNADFRLDMHILRQTLRLVTARLRG